MCDDFLGLGNTSLHFSKTCALSCKLEKKSFIFYFLRVKNRELSKKAGPEAWKRPQKVERDCYTLFLTLSFAFEQQGKSEKWLNFGKIWVRNNV